MRKFISLLLLFCGGSLLFAAESGSNTFEFVNQDLQDIVYILADNLTTPVICDETVSGKGSFLYSGGSEKSAEETFLAFLKTNRLYLEKGENLWTVSRILVDCTPLSEGNPNCLISLDAYDANLAQIFGKLSEATGTCIVYEVLPSSKTEIHIKNQPLASLLKTVMSPYAGYEVVEKENGIGIARSTDSYGNGTLGKSFSDSQGFFEIQETKGLYSGKIRNETCDKVIESFFELKKSDYSSFLNGNTRILDLSFSEKTFEDALKLIMEQAGGEAVFYEGIWYLFQSKSPSVAQEKKSADWKWNLYKLKNTEAVKVLPVLAQEFQDIKFMQAGNYDIAFFCDDKNCEKILKTAGTLDVKDEYEIIKLKYIKTAELMDHLPPGISKANVWDTGTGDSVYFSGTDEVKKSFLELLSEMDRPKKVIRYDLLILQYTKGSSLSWGISQGARNINGKDRTCLAGELGSVMNINFDLITHFGLLFSEKINAAVAENKASVFADTTLYGLEGEKISFKNTNTYRYRDITSTNEKAFTSITREINSGLVLDIDGWVSGDGMITMEVKASVSKQGVDLSGNTGNPPPTSEKYITTKVRARNGEPVILSGLSQRDLSQSSQGVPLLSKVPVAGNLFKNTDSDDEKTEMTIYLVPHIEEENLKGDYIDWKTKALELVSEKAE